MKVSLTSKAGRLHNIDTPVVSKQSAESWPQTDLLPATARSGTAETLSRTEGTSLFPANRRWKIVFTPITELYSSPVLRMWRISRPSTAQTDRQTSRDFSVIMSESNTEIRSDLCSPSKRHVSQNGERASRPSRWTRSGGKKKTAPRLSNHISRRRTCNFPTNLLPFHNLKINTLQ